jgi:hypothetical protein
MKKIAIHHRPGSFSERWIAYCEREKIPYKIVNAFDSDIIQQMNDCSILMWHHHHGIYKDVVAAKRILFALEHSGINVFPNYKTGWHFDDKVAQKYLLEAIGAPLVPSHVFYSKEDAIAWANTTSYPKVFKLKGGAGASNVRLVKTKKEALKIIKKAFGNGFPLHDQWGNLFENIRKFRENNKPMSDVLKELAKIFIKPEFSRQQPKEKGYVYFQDFMPKNNFDYRVIVIGGKAFAIKRLVRKNDFRASGSGFIEYSRDSIDENCVRIAFEVNEKIDAQCIAYDFIYDENKNPVIVEICYGFSVGVYDKCPGFWDKNMNWHEGNFVPQEWMIELNLTE